MKDYPGHFAKCLGQGCIGGAGLPMMIVGMYKHCIYGALFGFALLGLGIHLTGVTAEKDAERRARLNSLKELHESNGTGS